MLMFFQFLLPLKNDLGEVQKSGTLTVCLKHSIGSLNKNIIQIWKKDMQPCLIIRKSNISCWVAVPLASH